MHGKEWDLLLYSDTTELPVHIGNICRACGIVAVTYSAASALIKEKELFDYTENDAFTSKIQGRYIIFYRGDLEVDEMRCAVMHEVAHIVCGHTSTESAVFDGEATTWNRHRVRPPNIIEEAADDFAASVLAPACVLWALKIRRTNEIEKLCGVTRKLARRRAERMEELYAREERFLAYKGMTCFLMSEKERRLYDKFKDFISKNKPPKKRSGRVNDGDRKD